MSNGTPIFGPLISSFVAETFVSLANFSLIMFVWFDSDFESPSKSFPISEELVMPSLALISFPTELESSSFGSIETLPTFLSSAIGSIVTLSTFLSSTALRLSAFVDADTILAPRRAINIKVKISNSFFICFPSYFFNIFSYIH